MTSKTKPESEDGCRLLLWLVLAWKGSLMPQDMSSEQTYSIQADTCWGVGCCVWCVDDMIWRPPDVEGEVLCGWQVGVRERQRLCRGNRGPWEDLRCTILYNGWRVGIIIWTPSKGCIHHRSSHPSSCSPCRQWSRGDTPLPAMWAAGCDRAWLSPVKLWWSRWWLWWLRWWFWWTWWCKPPQRMEWIGWRVDSHVVQVRVPPEVAVVLLVSV